MQAGIGQPWDGLHRVQVGLPLGQDGLQHGGFVYLGLRDIAAAYQAVKPAPTQARQHGHERDGDQQLNQGEAALLFHQ